MLLHKPRESSCHRTGELPGGTQQRMGQRWVTQALQTFRFCVSLKLWLASSLPLWQRCPLKDLGLARRMHHTHTPTHTHRCTRVRMHTQRLPESQAEGPACGEARDLAGSQSWGSTSLFRRVSLFLLPKAPTLSSPASQSAVMC